MGTGTRGASAALSRRVKQEVVRLLFGPSLAGKGPDAHRQLDHSIYTYDQLRKAYLERVQALHPDKVAHKKHNDNNDRNNNSDSNNKVKFVELQEAWSKYEEVARMMKTVDNGAPEANFTLFGVGCSFSDNDAERAMRAEITDQASRGWFSSGLIADTSNSSVSHVSTAAMPAGKGTTASTTRSNHVRGNLETGAAASKISLCDDDWFVHATDTKQRKPAVEHSTTSTKKRTTLVSGFKFMGGKVSEI